MLRREFVEISRDAEMLRGVLHYPKQWRNNISYPCVIFCPGLNGNRYDLNRILLDMAVSIQEKNMYCLRFDYFGTGMSDGYFSQTTVSTKVADLKYVFEYVSINNKRFSSISILSLSDGAQVVSRAINELREMRFCHFVFWSPIIIDRKGQKLSCMKLIRDSITKVPCISFLGLKMSLGYLKEKNSKFEIEFCKISDSIRERAVVIYAMDDEMILESLDLFEKCKIKTIEVDEGGHSFCSSKSHTKVIHETLRHLMGVEW